jgi:ribosome-associated translation inhibitor RaiA
MQTPLELVNRTHADLPDVIEKEIINKAAKLEHYYSPIESCRVTVEAQDGHHRQGFYNVRIDIGLKGGELPATRQPPAELAVAVREAFDAARRRLQDHARQQRGTVKQHGEVVR